MNKFHKIFAGLFAALALTAFAATGAMAQDTETDNHDVSIEPQSIQLLDVKNSGSTNSSSDEADELTFTFDDSSIGTAGSSLATESKDVWLAWTTNESAEITICTSTPFTDFGSGISNSELVVNVNESWLATGSAGSGAPYTVVDGGQSSDCKSKTGRPQIVQGISPGAETGDGGSGELTYEATYDVADGNFSSDTAELTYTIQ